jgi:hypothetical protein
MAQDTILLATIAANASISNAVDVSGFTIVSGVVMPSTWTPAQITVQGSADGINFYDFYDGMPAVELSINVHPGSIVAINPDRFRCCKAIKIRSGTGAKPVVQTAARQFGVIVNA